MYHAVYCKHVLVYYSVEISYFVPSSGQYQQKKEKKKKDGSDIRLIEYRIL